MSPRHGGSLNLNELDLIKCWNIDQDSGYFVPIVRTGGRSPPQELPFTLLDTGSFLHAVEVCSSEKAICITVSGVQQEDRTQDHTQGIRLYGLMYI